MPEKILIVDDEIDTLQLVGMMLESRGYQIIATGIGHKAIELARAEQPSLILLDIMMPGMDGYEVTRQLRGNAETRQIPIILFTAKTDMDSKVLGLELGAEAYLTKPISTRELLAHVKSVLAQAQTREMVTHELTGSQGKGCLVAIIAPKGGLGISTAALNLGIALHKHTGQNVVVADFRPGQGSLSLDLGLLHPEGLNHLLQMDSAEITRQAVEKELTSHKSGVRLLLSSPQPRDARYLSAVDNFEKIARNLRHLADYVILDLGPGLTPVNDRTIVLCDQVFVVIEPHPGTVAQGRFLTDNLVSAGLRKDQIEAVLVSRAHSAAQLTLSQVQEQLGYQVSIDFSPEPDLAYQAYLRNKPMVLLQPNGLVAQQFQQMAAKLAAKLAADLAVNLAGSAAHRINQLAN